LGILSTPASVKNLAGELGISQGMTYKHLKDLLNEKYITETLHTFELTLIGRIMASPLIINDDDFDVKDLPVKNATD
jgi:predicted transcriptional regulator